MHASLIDDLGVQYLEQAQLADFTTFQLGGPCRGLIQCETPFQLRAVIQKLKEDSLPYILIGGGSNICVSDQGLDAYVVRYDSKVPQIEIEDNQVFVTASTQLDHLAHYCANNGLEGINCATGIPGTVGGAIVGNAGAFGKQIADVLTTVVLLDDANEMIEVSPERLGFSYRYSKLKETGEIVVSVQLTLTPGDKDQLLKERKEILEVRSQKHPNLSQHPCAGSFFRNIEPTSSAGQRQATGWFLDQAGGKSLHHGGAKIYDKHANIIVKGENCTSQDVYELQKQMARLVKEKYDLELVREVRFVGEFEGKPEDLQKYIW